MTVIDSSAVVDLLVTDGAEEAFDEFLFEDEHASLAAPDLLVFEVLAALRRMVTRGVLSPSRAGAAVDDLGDLRIDLAPTLILRDRAWQLRENLSMGDALFVSLAETLQEPLATADRRLARAVRQLTGIEPIELGA